MTNRLSTVEEVYLRSLVCKWVKAFDGHYNIGCVNETNQRANGNFKGKNAKWQFEYCPYCSREIELHEEFINE